ncbi:hypothetical protein M2164_005992 [Streptomyces sp. SAI-208]|uniref:hypothetical protein n=1 Tax=Streptomyces sp. SAI-208 TaxID=2940550 RepID=UPI002476E4D7|nr:hypothetical protein [Streptomyces sp. SAI-208]MDH6610357.1 hypothetical protein [Streptomyces sp. SAI-208]
MAYRPYPNVERALKQSERRYPLIRAVVTTEGDTIIESIGGRFAPRIIRASQPRIVGGAP